jgi:hypothetical protein
LIAAAAEVDGDALAVAGFEVGDHLGGLLFERAGVDPQDRFRTAGVGEALIEVDVAL